MYNEHFNPIYDIIYDENFIFYPEEEILLEEENEEEASDIIMA